jgi:hypothetical protein
LFHLNEAQEALFHLNEASWASEHHFSPNILKKHYMKNSQDLHINTNFQKDSENSTFVVIQENGEKSYNEVSNHSQKIIDYLPKPKNSKDIKLTIVSVLFAAVCLFIVAYSNAATDTRNPNIGVQDESPNFEHIQDWIIDSTKDQFNRIFNNVSMGDKWLLGTFLMLSSILLSSQKRFFTMIRRLAYVVGVMFLLRALCINLTLLPTPYDKCFVEDRSGSVLLHAFQIFIGQRVSCGDVFFSGHTIIYTLGTWVFITYQTSTIVNIFAAIYNLIGMLFLISSGLHYSIDVLTSFLLTSFTWNFFHYGWTISAFQDKYWGTLLRILDDTRPSGQNCHDEYYNDPVNQKMNTNLI